jgi:hypothetical protein
MTINYLLLSTTGDFINGFTILVESETKLNEYSPSREDMWSVNVSRALLYIIMNEDVCSDHSAECLTSVK